jgi:hypothetical protein
MNNKAIKFIRKAVAMRQHLLKAKASQKNALQMAQYLGMLNKQLDIPKSNIGEAQLVLKYEVMIREILPGLTARNGEALHREFTRLVLDAKLFIQSFQHQTI